jgi:hypothetical protein
MATKKMNELTELTEVASDDLVMVFDASESGSEQTKKYPLQNLKTDLTSMDPSAFGNWVLVKEYNSSSTVALTMDNIDNERFIKFSLSVTSVDSNTDIVLSLGDNSSFDYNSGSYQGTLNSRRILEDFSGSFSLTIIYDVLTKICKVVGTSNNGSSSSNVDVSIKYVGALTLTRIMIQSYRSSSILMNGSFSSYTWQEVKPIELHSYELVKEYNLNNETLDDTFDWDGESDDVAYCITNLTVGRADMTLNGSNSYTLRRFFSSGSGLVDTSDVAATHFNIGFAERAQTTFISLRTGNVCFNSQIFGNNIGRGMIAAIWNDTSNPVTYMSVNTDGSNATGNIRIYKLAKTHLFNQTIYNNTTLNVATTGSDTTGDGTLQKPFATINGALDWLKNKTINTDANVIIQVADGTYNNQSRINFTHPSKNISIKGNTTTPSNVTLNFATGSSGLEAIRNTYISIQGVKLVGYDKSEWRSGIDARYGAVIYVTNCVLDDWGVGAKGAYGGVVNLINNYTINNCNYGANGYAGGFAYLYSGTVSNCNAGVATNDGGRLHYSANVSFSGNNSNTYTATGGTITTG